MNKPDEQAAKILKRIGERILERERRDARMEELEEQIRALQEERNSLLNDSMIGPFHMDDFAMARAYAAGDDILKAKLEFDKSGKTGR